MFGVHRSFPGWTLISLQPISSQSNRRQSRSFLPSEMQQRLQHPVCSCKRPAVLPILKPYLSYFLLVVVVVVVFARNVWIAFWSRNGRHPRVLIQQLVLGITCNNYFFFVVDLQQPCFSYTWSGCRSMFGRMDGWMDGWLLGWNFAARRLQTFLFWRKCQLAGYYSLSSGPTHFPCFATCSPCFAVCCFFSLFWLIINSKKTLQQLRKTKNKWQ